MKKRIGILTSGSDCPGINTVIDAVVKGLGDEYEVIGFYRGWEGLLDKNYILLDRKYTSQNRWIGGSILKSGYKGQFPSSRDHTETFDSRELELVEQSLRTYEELRLEGLIVIAGDGTLYTACKLAKYGFNIIGIPKSIDNDLECTDFNFGFHTAVEIANSAIDRLHTSASSHDKVMILEVMGRTAGWIGLYSGLAGGANMIIIPEMPFSYSKIGEYLDERYSQHNKSAIIVVSESAVSRDEATFFEDRERRSVYFGAGDKIASYINQNTEYEASSTSIGNLQRGGSPNAFDKVIASQVGAFAASMVLRNRFAKLAVFNNNQLEEIELNNSALSLKLISPFNQTIMLAKSVGVSFGE